MTLQKQAEQQLNSTEKSMAAPRRDNPIFPPPPPLPSTLLPTQETMHFAYTNCTMRGDNPNCAKQECVNYYNSATASPFLFVSFRLAAQSVWLSSSTPNSFARAETLVQQVLLIYTRTPKGAILDARNDTCSTGF